MSGTGVLSTFGADGEISRLGHDRYCAGASRGAASKTTRTPLSLHCLVLHGGVTNRKSCGKRDCLLEVAIVSFRVGT